MMMKREPVCHKTEWQRHYVLRNCSSGLSTYTYIALSSYQLGKNGGGVEGNRQSTRHLGYHLPASPSCGKTGFTKHSWIREEAGRPYLVTGPLFLYWERVARTLIKDDLARDIPEVARALQNSFLHQWSTCQRKKFKLSFFRLPLSLFSFYLLVILYPWTHLISFQWSSRNKFGRENMIGNLIFDLSSNLEGKASQGQDGKKLF
jgi:hypothetical protein